MAKRDELVVGVETHRRLPDRFLRWHWRADGGGAVGLRTARSTSWGAPRPLLDAPAGAALAALIWSRHPDWTSAQIREALQAAALDLNAPGHDWETRYGLMRLP